MSDSQLQNFQWEEDPRNTFSMSCLMKIKTGQDTNRLDGKEVTVLMHSSCDIPYICHMMGYYNHDKNGGDYYDADDFDKKIEAGNFTTMPTTTATNTTAANTSSNVNETSQDDHDTTSTTDRLDHPQHPTSTPPPPPPSTTLKLLPKPTSFIEKTESKLVFVPTFPSSTISFTGFVVSDEQPNHLMNHHHPSFSVVFKNNRFQSSHSLPKRTRSGDISRAFFSTFCAASAAGGSSTSNCTSAASTVHDITTMDNDIIVSTLHHHGDDDDAKAQVPIDGSIEIYLKDITSIVIHQQNSWLISLHTHHHDRGIIYDITTSTSNSRDLFLIFLKTFLRNYDSILVSVVQQEKINDTNMVTFKPCPTTTTIQEKHMIPGVVDEEKQVQPPLSPMILDGIDMQRFHDIALKNTLLQQESILDKFLRWSKRISCDWNSICYCGENDPRSTSTISGPNPTNVRDVTVSSYLSGTTTTTNITFVKGKTMYDDSMTEMSELEYDLEDLNFPTTLY